MFEPVIGLEIHLALRTRSKLFCGCPADPFGAAPNAHACPVCLGLPGSLPVPNREAIDRALRLALALRCEVPDVARFHRKNYYYPDAPKNYQISQFDRPVGEGGRLELDGGRVVGITRIHVEEDAGRSVHPPYAPHSLVDLGRAGAPLIEMVTEPELRDPEEARVFLERVRSLARALGVSDASPEEGKMRADVNVSVRRPGEPLGTKVEVKNLNSFKSVAAALAFEIRRQTALLEEGRSVRQETRGWNEGGQKTYTMRVKEGESDYRYFPDPDLPPMPIGRAWLERVRASLPELPAAKRERYLALGLRPADAERIAFDVGTAAMFDAAVAEAAGSDAPLAGAGAEDPARGGASAASIANWLVGDVAGLLNASGRSLADVALTPAALAALVGMVESGAVSGAAAKRILPEVVDGADPARLVEERGLGQITDEGALRALVERVVSANPDVVASVADNPKAANALLGRVMRESGGKAAPDVARRLLEERLGLG